MSPLSLVGMIDRMFDQVLTEDERVELLAWIEEWETANPDADSAHRVTGWIDVAYAFQARTPRTPRPRGSARRSSAKASAWSVAPAVS